MATILVVEDDPQLLAMLAEHLRDCGYEVLEASNADEAMALLGSGVASVDIVFGDILMPGHSNGYDLARWLRRNRPEIRVVLSSGHTERAPPDASELVDVPLLAKPYRLGVLEALMANSPATKGPSPDG